MTRTLRPAKRSFSMKLDPVECKVHSQPVPTGAESLRKIHFSSESSGQQLLCCCPPPPEAARGCPPLQLFVRRELSDNFCFHQPQYDSLDGAAGWAKETLQVHAKDPREVCAITRGIGSANAVAEMALAFFRHPYGLGQGVQWKPCTPQRDSC